MSLIALIAIAVALAVVLLGIAIFPLHQYPDLTKTELRGVPGAAKRIELQNERARLRNDFRNSLLQPFTVLTIFGTILFTWQQLQSQNQQREEQSREFTQQLSLSREGQTADRYTHAIDQLTNDRQEIRAGGLYALGEISNQGSTHKPGTASGLRATIDQLVAGYLRSRFPLKHIRTCEARPIKQAAIGAAGVPISGFDPLQEGVFPRAKVDEDAAMTVLGERIPGTLAVVDLKRVDLVGVTAPGGAQLRGAKFDGSWLDFGYFWRAHLFRASLNNVVACNSNFSRADLRQSEINDSELNGSSLALANLSSAWLTGATLAHANLTEANLSHANLSNADLRKSNLTGANLSDADLFHANLDGAIANKKTIWPTGFDWRNQGVKYCLDSTSC